MQDSLPVALQRSYGFDTGWIFIALFLGCVAWLYQPSGLTLLLLYGVPIPAQILATWFANNVTKVSWDRSIERIKNKRDRASKYPSNTPEWTVANDAAREAVHDANYTNKTYYEIRRDNWTYFFTALIIVTAFLALVDTENAVAAFGEWRLFLQQHPVVIGVLFGIGTMLIIAPLKKHLRRNEDASHQNKG